MATMNIRLEDELKAQLQAIAQSQKLPLSYIARCALENYVQNWTTEQPTKEEK